METSARGENALDRLRPVFETALDAVVGMRQDGVVAEWNQAAELTFGWTREEAVGQLMADLIVPPQHRAAHIEGISRYNRTGQASVLGQRLEITAIDRAQREFPIELSITATGTPDQTLFIGFIRDISDRKRSEALLIRQAREAELLFNISRFAAETGSVDAVLEETLRAICELARWPVGHALVVPQDKRDELVSTGIWVGAGDEDFDELRRATQAIRFTPGVGLPGTILQAGEPVWVTDTENDASFLRKGHGFGAGFGFPVKSGGQTIAVLEFFTRDKTPPDPELLLTVRTLGEQVGRVLERSKAVGELRKLNETLEARVLERTRELEDAQDALRQAQKMEAIGQLTGGIAHDFNNLLTVIRGSADLLRRRDLTDEKRRRYVDAISDTADRAARLTGQLLAFARRQALKPEVFDAASRVRSIADMLQTVLGSRVQLAIDDRCGDCFVEADAAQFETALVNLVLNARDAMDGEGKLTLSVLKEQGSEGGEMVTLTISDTGHGIAEDQLAHVFEPFYTTKEVGKGTGLGLSQVYGFVKQSGGEISVESEVGVGTAFVISFPRAPVDRAPEPDKAPRTAHDAAAGSRVLIVEDNADVGRFASQLLGDLGFETTLAASASEALEQLALHAGQFDVVFSDVVMPGMNGVEFGKMVRKSWPRLPIVLTSGYSDVLAEESRHNFPLLHKPYSAEALSRALRQARRGSAPAG